MSNVETRERHTIRRRARRAKVGAAAAVGAFCAGVPATASFASTPDPDAAAGAAVTELGERGESFIGTYAIPAAMLVIGASFGFFLLMRISKKVRGGV